MMLYVIEKGAVAEKQHYGDTYGIQCMVGEYKEQGVDNQLCQSITQRNIQVRYLALVAKRFV